MGEIITEMSYLSWGYVVQYGEMQSEDERPKSWILIIG